MPMEFRHLQTFQAILEAGSFLEASEQLQYAQSTITLHIQQLEAELGVKVFSRRGKKVQLTSAGRALEAHANFLLHRAEMLHREMAELVAGEAGHLRIGSIEPVASLRLPSLLVSFCRQYPHVRLTLETGVTQVISQRVAEGKLDLAVCSPPIARLGLSFETMFYDSMALLIPEEHPLSKKHTLQATDITGERLLLTEANCPYREVFEKEILARSVNPYSGLEIMSLKALQSMVESGLGIGVMPMAIIDPPPQGTVVRSVNDLNLELPVGIALLPEGSVPGLALDLLTQTLRNGMRNLAI
jgi:LysR family transcriptional regulator, regulator of the ytmI operon